MLFGSNLPTSLTKLLVSFQPLFTAPSFTTFCAMVNGFFAQTGEHNVCGMLSGAGLAQTWHHSRAHRFFSTRKWSIEEMGLHLLTVIVSMLLGNEDPLELVVDDTLLHRVGRKVFGARWCHDGSAKTPHAVGFGNCFVVIGIVVSLPFCTRKICLPVLFHLWTKGSKVSMAHHMAQKIAAHFPERAIHVTGDAAYASKELRSLPRNVTWTTRLRKNAALYDLAPQRTTSRGRPRTRGTRLPQLVDLAASLYWMQRTVTRYDTSATVEIAHRRVLWYTVFGPREVRVVLVRELKSSHAYNVALITTDLAATPEQIVERYAARWSMEVAFEEAKQVTGVGEARNRTRNAVQRTAPFGFLCQSLLTLWYATALHHDDIVKERRQRSPWYTTKLTPSTADMLVIARREILTAQFSAVCHSDLNNTKIRGLLQVLDLLAA